MLSAALANFFSLRAQVTKMVPQIVTPPGINAKSAEIAIAANMSNSKLD
jgi:hypothetical protein